MESFLAKVKIFSFWPKTMDYSQGFCMTVFSSVYGFPCRSKDVIDIDQLEDCNCAVSGEYAREIFSYLREAEVGCT